jgi:hypothetical protein
LLCLWISSHSARVGLVDQQTSLVCGPSACDPSAFAHNRAPGSKVSDEFTPPLCRLHHCESYATTQGLSETYPFTFAIFIDELNSR